MEDAGLEQSQDDFEVEISDLDKPDNTAGSSQPGRRGPLWRLLPRRRRVQLIVINGLLILVMIIILASTAPVRGLVGGVFFGPTPTPTPTLAPDADLFYVRGDPSWGRLLIDGHPTALPVIGTDPPLRLTRGRHVLTWQAPPFLNQQCTVSVPPVPLTDTCSANETAEFDSIDAWVISFSVSLANLSGKQRTALLQSAQATLDARQSSDTVRPGERYILAPNNPACRNHAQGYQCYATASQPLRATLSFRLDTNEASSEQCIGPQPGICILNKQDCRLFCTGGFLISSSPREWAVFAPVLSLWTFATMGGRVLERDVPNDSAWDYATGQALDESLVQLAITWDGQGWRVALSANLDSQSVPNAGYFDPVCAAMEQQVDSVVLPAMNGVTVSFQWQFASGSLPAAGCVAVGTPQPDELTTPTPAAQNGPAFYYLHRFGVLLSLNQQAQDAGLLLPFADAYEQQLARGLIALVESQE